MRAEGNETKRDDASTISGISDEASFVDDTFDFSTDIYWAGSFEEQSFPDGASCLPMLMDTDVSTCCTTVPSQAKDPLHRVLNKQQKELLAAPSFPRKSEAPLQEVSPSVLGSLPNELLCSIASFLPVSSLKNCLLLNRRYYQLLSSNGAGWEDRCRDLWSRRIHVAPIARELLQHKHVVDMKVTVPNLLSTSTAIEAFRMSCRDAQCRQEVTTQELCYDFESSIGTIWNFRFKESAGGEWTASDPWHQQQSARQMVFLRDGTVQQLDCTTNSDRPRLHLPFYDATDSTTEGAGLVIKWKFVRKPMDFPKRKDGAYLRLNIGGRDVPTYVVQRSPNGNWGFLLENCWGVFASFELPRKRPTTLATRYSAPSPHHARGRIRARSINRTLYDSQSLQQKKNKRRKLQSDKSVSIDEELLGDSSLSVTNGWQWREALLYNLGASHLPDGQVATDLDLAWSRDANEISQEEK